MEGIHWDWIVIVAFGAGGYAIALLKQIANSLEAIKSLLLRSVDTGSRTD